ncbi:hypothetical protein BLNAU_23621 [Blattamonas nauphoetae]|uniref:Uncharacterized protein n=1 Tax=Blattamonas nauphoetae TaxID=2049346 RepID=A0ABQ9WPR5_9EUKA|nr:hypothetical protein BLNAU_23621 [Blattamonas nauphoetae]
MEQQTLSVRVIFVGSGITSWFAQKIEIFSRQSRSMVTTLSFLRHCIRPASTAHRRDKARLHPHQAIPFTVPHHPRPPSLLCLSLTTHTLPLPSASPSPPTPSLSPLPFPHHPRPPTPLCLSLSTHTLPLPSTSPSPPTPSHSPLPLPHHPHPPTPSASLTTHTLHSPLPLPLHPHPPSLLCLSLTTHALPLSSASPSPPTPSHSPLPLPHHPHPPTPLYLSLTTHTLPLPSASPSPPTPSLSPLPLPHHQHPPSPLCLSLTKLGVMRTGICSFEANTLRSSASLLVALANNTSTDDTLSPHTSPNQPQPHSREGRDCCWLTSAKPTQASPAVCGRSDRQNTDTADLAASHVVSTVAAILADTHHIVAFADSMHRCCLVTPRTAGDTEVPVDSARVEPDIAEVVESDEWRRGWDEGGVGCVPSEEMEDRDRKGDEEMRVGGEEKI